jgi:putative RNA 2'-phosphotransferase
LGTGKNDDRSYAQNMDHELVHLSKFISLVLRHQPGKIGLTLDEAGWTDVDALLAGMRSHGIEINQARLERVVAENDKQRFAFNPDHTRIRANQGHSIQVQLDLPQLTPPEYLYHGTAVKYIDSIRRNGLLKGRRHAVHLSPDMETARKVGQRHGQPVVLTIQAGRMAGDGFVFTRSENGVWLTEAVPPQYITEQ